MNRRDFLKALIAGGATAAAVLASDAAMAQMLPNRYQKLIRAQAHVYSIQASLVDLRGTPKLAERRKMLAPGVAEVFRILQTDFNGAEALERDKEAMFEGIRKVFTHEGMIDTMSEDELRRYENPIIAVATARYMLAYRKVTFDPQYVPHWDGFVRLYQGAIIHA